VAYPVFLKGVGGGGCTVECRAVGAEGMKCGGVPVATGGGV